MKGPLSEKEFYEIQAETCKVLANPKRLEILHALRNGEQTVGDLVEILGVPKANVSQHLADLKIERDLPPHVFAKEDFPVVVRVRNQKSRLDSFAINVEDSMLPFSNRGLSARWVRSLGSSELEFSTRVPRRGILDC